MHVYPSPGSLLLKVVFCKQNIVCCPAETISEFIQEGERHFKDIRIETYAQLGQDLELKQYLKEQDFKNNPLDFSNGILWRLQASYLNLPYLRAQGADFRWGANFEGANLSNADLRGARLIGANLRGANVTGANLSRIDLYRADIRGIRGLENALNVHEVNPEGILANEKEKDIMKRALETSAYVFL